MGPPDTAARAFEYFNQLTFILLIAVFLVSHKLAPVVKKWIGFDS